MRRGVQARVFLVSAKDAAAEATLALLVQGALEGKAAPQREGSEADLLAALAAPRRAVLEWAAEALEELPVQAQIVLYLVLLVAFFVLVCPLLRPLLPHSRPPARPSPELRRVEDRGVKCANALSGRLAVIQSPHTMTLVELRHIFFLLVSIY